MTEEEKHKRRISNQQMRYWRLLIRIMGNSLNIDTELMHQLMAFKFMRAKRWNEILQEEEEYVRSSKDIPMQEFSEIKEALQHYCSEKYDIYLPDPLEQIKFEYD